MEEIAVSIILNKYFKSPVSLAAVNLSSSSLFSLKPKVGHLGIPSTSKSHTGKLLINPPSTIKLDLSLSSIRIGLKINGIEILILTALAILKFKGSMLYFTKSSGKTTNSFLVESAVIIFKGLVPSIDISLNLVLPFAFNFSSIKFSRASPLNNPLFFTILKKGPAKGILLSDVLSMKFLKSRANEISFSS